MGTTETAPALNRKGRRANNAMVRKIHGFNLKERARKQRDHESTQRALGLAFKLDLVRRRTVERDALRKQIAKREGVNWRRVVLMGDGQQYVIKKHYGKGKGNSRRLHPAV